MTVSLMLHRDFFYVRLLALEKTNSNQIKKVTSLCHLYVRCNAAACDLPRHITQPLLQ